MRQRPDVVRYYSAAGADYRAWSRDFHMHFGYWRRWLNPFAREGMLIEMTRRTVAALELDPQAPLRVLDSGCGLGAGARVAAADAPGWTIDAISLVSGQIETARARTAGEPFADRIRFRQADYTATPFADGAFDGIFAIESACHDEGLDKRGFVAEAARLLRPGGRLVVADGFLKGAGPTNPLLGFCLDRVCANWALSTFAEIGLFVRGLEAHGFETPRVEELSWRIAPSVAHVPWVTARFLIGELVRDGLRLGPDRWGHLLACVLAPVVGLARSRFGYFRVSAIRRGSSGR